MFRIEFPEILAWFQTPQTVSRPSRPDFQPRQTNSGTRRPIEIFKKRKMIRIEFPKVLAWFQTPQTVSRLSRPSRPSSQTNFGTRRRIEIFQKSKMIRIENPKLLAWFQTPQTVSRPSRPNFQPHRTVEHTSQKLVSPQPPFTLKPRPKGAKKISGLVPDTSYRFQTVQTQFPASQNC